MNFTPLALPLFALRRRAVKAWTQSRGGVERAQLGQLRRLLREARDTETGRRFGFGDIVRETDIRRAFAALPVHEYEDIRAEVMRMVMGEPDVLWPGRTLRFAQSSGTSGGKSKYIPVTDAALNVLDRMEEFYRGFPQEVQAVLAFEREKFIDGDNRYAWKIRRTFDGGFVKKGMELARQRQEDADV